MSQSSRQTTLPGMAEAGELPPTEPDAGPGDAPSGDADAAGPQPLLPPADWTICAVDAHSLIFQVFHAMHGSELSSPSGEPVGAVYGFTRDMLQLIERKQPDAVFCAFDLSGPTFRHDLYEPYKGDRSEMPVELAAQIPKIQQMLEALGIPILSSEGFEADDVLATLARLCDESGARCLIVTGDKDCRQLISDRVAVYNIRKDEEYDAESLKNDWGIRPEQVVDFQALVGDKIDNVPGVPLIGPKLARELLEKFGTVEEVLDHADEVSGKKRRQNLIDYREDALMSRRLVELDRNVPIKPNWQAGRVGQVQHERLSELFREFGFRSLADRAAALGGQQPVASVAQWQGDYRVVNTPEALAELIEQASTQPILSIDTETTDRVPRQADLVGYSFAWTPGVAYYVPVRGPEGTQVLDPEATADALRPLLENPAVAKIGQNLKYDMVVLKKSGIRLAGVAFDTMVASYLLDSGERSHNLDQLASRYLNHATIKIESLIGTGKNQKRMDEVPIEQIAPYAAEDADVPLRLYPLLRDRLVEAGLEQLSDEVETPLIEILADIEYLGVPVNVERLAELSELYAARLKVLEEQIEEMAGHPLNIGSPKQLAELLFSELNLPVVKRTKTGPSTDASVLEELASLHPLPAKIVEYRQYAKLLGTYIDAIPKLVHPETGRVHASLNQVVAATGRLSSSNPNLQNIPVRTDEGREIRSAFCAGPDGWQLLAADYSQIELRVLAHYCGDESLRQAFENDLDIHQMVASQVNDVALDEVTPEMRRRAKAVNFGIIYGQSPFGLAKGLGITVDEAAVFIETYFARYPGVLDFMVATLESCRAKGYVTTLLGRRRAVQGVRPVAPGLRDANGSLRQLTLPERTAVNTVIQGSAADLIKLAMLAVARRLKEEQHPARMLLQIHDELLFETPSEEIESLTRLVEQEMEGVLDLETPLRVDVKTGPDWASCR